MVLQQLFHADATIVTVMNFDDGLSNSRPVFVIDTIGQLALADSRQFSLQTVSSDLILGEIELVA